MVETIRATARFQEAAEPIKQRPIIQVEAASHQQQQQQQQQQHLPNTIRASMDSQGRDNPFRPDGKIYKSADPIVDFYKYGPNQSRSATPADGQLLSSGGNLNSISKKQSSTSDKVKAKGELGGGGGGDNNEHKKPCWRRWLCCCCCCCFKTNTEQDKKVKKESIVLDRETKLVVVDQKLDPKLEEPHHDHQHQHQHKKTRKQQVSMNDKEEEEENKVKSKKAKTSQSISVEEQDRNNSKSKRCLVS